jgi:hypothetical protein
MLCALNIMGQQPVSACTRCITQKINGTHELFSAKQGVGEELPRADGAGLVRHRDEVVAFAAIRNSPRGTITRNQSFIHQKHGKLW